MTFPFPVLVGGKASPANLTYITTLVNTTDGTTFTFSSIAIGAAKAGRAVILASTVSPNTTSISTMSMTASAGTPTTAVTMGSTIFDTDHCVGIGFIQVPTGTTTNVTVTLDQTGETCVLSVWTVDNISTVFDTLTSSASTKSLTMDLDKGNNGIIIGCRTNSISSGGTNTWTGATKRSDQAFDIDSHFSVADFSGGTAETPHALSNLISGGTVFSCTAAATSFI